MSFEEPLNLLCNCFQVLLFYLICLTVLVSSDYVDRILSCHDIKCHLVDVICICAPCYSIPEFYSPNPSCKGHKCPKEQHCKLVNVQCMYSCSMPTSSSVRREIRLIRIRTNFSK
ncbi:hypothetical protein L596_013914 [Steinernema carpocapsae]|uniref:Uncharacterized protein n=1 Tax=Steinernema carpocapsae TaxID=34508 RepID=A0A4U5P302_STECR|nr:hypothetical protein L596_013914 [Steinernema carpocapsae]